VLLRKYNAYFLLRRRKVFKKSCDCFLLSKHSLDDRLDNVGRWTHVRPVQRSEAQLVLCVEASDTLASERPVLEL